MTVMTLFSIKTYSKGIYFRSLVNWQKTVISVMEGKKPIIRTDLIWKNIFFPCFHNSFPYSYIWEK